MKTKPMLNDDYYKYLFITMFFGVYDDTQEKNKDFLFNCIKLLYNDFILSPYADDLTRHELQSIQAYLLDYKDNLFSVDGVNLA